MEGGLPTPDAAAVGGGGGGTCGFGAIIGFTLCNKAPGKQIQNRLEITYIARK